METIFDSCQRVVRRSRAGSSLLIVLAFVVLLTGLILAFFSRSIIEEQISNSSANQVKVDNFALGAVSTTLSDLKQEIEAGSGTPVFPVTGNNYIYYYTPSAGSAGNNYPTMLPAVTGSSSGSAPGATFGSNSLASGAFANLVKISLHGTKFYGTTTVPAAYSSSITDPTRAAAISSGSSSDTTGTMASGSTDGTSINGRYVSGSRWNKPLFLAPGTVFPLPDWVYVERTPTTVVQNATAWNANLISSPTNMTTTTTVLGRYAYAIYDEGGLLDINAAGTPTPLAPAGTLASLSAYKSAEAMADLTQIPGITQTIADTIVGWRNNASAAQWQGTSVNTPLSGNVTSGYTWNTTNGTNYFYNVLFNPTGFLRPVSTGTTTGTLAQTDQFFTSRQQLLQFFNNVLGGGTTVNGALQYLTHFSRSLEQPSYAPPNGSKPATATIASGGNDLGGGDTTVNPAFLSARVTNQYQRNDGSIANVGDPLVKKRFALNRLAWLTCNGPIANDSGTLNPNNDATIATIITTLEKNYGYTAAFLAQGGPTNIYKYFGLQWVTDSRGTVGDGQSKWFYNHEVAAFPNLSSVSSPSAAHIRTLLSTGSSNVPSQGRDADFFELLKAGTSLGSLGKAYGTSTGSGASSGITTAVSNFNIANPDPIAWQAQLDNSTDGSIVQMAANIIAQFQPSGYSPRILFYDGTVGYPLEFRGVEDLPYVYRVRQAEIMTADSTPSQTTLPSTAVTTLSAATQGSGVVMYQPEIWNPQGWNVNNPDTNPRPTSFRLVAISAPPNQITSADTSAYATPIQLETGWRWFTTANGGIDANPISTILNAANTAMTFNIPQGYLYLFREPTLLIKPGVPTGSALASAGATVTASNGITPITAAQYSQCGFHDNSQYIGITIGTLPMAWIGTIPAKGIDGTNPTVATTGAIPTGLADYASGPYGITYRLEYKNASGNWVVYDEKYSLPFQSGSWNTPVGGYVGANKTFGVEGSTSTIADCNIGAYGSYVAVDPRSSRFGMVYAGTNGRGLGVQQFPLGCTVNLTTTGQAGIPYYSGWAAPVGTGSATPIMEAAAANSAVWTARPDEYRGFCFSSYSNQSLDFGWDTGPFAGATPSASVLAAYGGWYPLPTSSNAQGTAWGSSAQIMPGMLVQNNPAVATATSGLRFSTDGGGPTTGYNQFFADADGVVRRAMSAYVPVSSGGAPATAASTGIPSGLPMKVAVDYTQNPPAPNSTTNEYQSRPIMLNRPFRSVAELGYAFSGTPWRNVDMSTPESGAAALLDVFCINDTDDPNGLVAGKVNLNTRQPLVLQAILNGAYTDEFNPNGMGNSAPLNSTYATNIAQALYNRTQNTSIGGLGPLRNISELVGKWNAASYSNTTSPTMNGGTSYIGFTSDTANSTGTSNTTMFDLTQALVLSGSGSGASADARTRVERFRDASVRTLANCGQTRVWNLMIDVIAQTGRFPSSATGLGNFVVEGEQRYWVHIAIDRYTGQVLDQQIEEVKE